VNPFGSAAFELALATPTSAGPSTWAGVRAVMEVLLTTVTFVAAVPPNETVAPLEKFDPVIVTFVPPVTGPEAGDTPLIETGGGGAGV
jgi:hypothetical protein